MIHSSRSSRTKITCNQSFVKASSSAAVIVVLLFLLIPHIWSENRKEYINLDGKAVAVETGVAGCGPYSFSPETRKIDKAGGSRNVTVHGGDGSGCAWSAVSAVPWITVTGSGNGNVTFTVAANTGVERAGIITIANQNPSVTHTVTQAAGCNQSFSPTNNNGISFAGTTGSIAVSSGMGCVWTAVSNAPSWLTVTIGGNGSGNGTVGYKVEANPGVQRSGEIKIGNSTFTVTQDPNCQLECYSLGEACSFYLSYLPDMCAAQCMAANNCNPGISQCAMLLGACVSQCIGNGQANNYSCNQYPACQTNCYDDCGYALSHTNASPSSGGISGTVNVSSAACGWTAVSNVSPTNKWLQVTSGASGTGNGTVGYTVSANTGPARTGTLTIAKKTFTVTQADGCTYNTINPTNASPAAGGGSGISVSITGSDASCVPTATSTDSWIKNITVSSGGTTKTVGYSIDANTGPARTGIIKIAGQEFTINQANGCTYNNIYPTNASPAAGGGAGTSVSITGSNTSCVPTATSTDSWIKNITVSGNASTKTVGYSIDANTGPARTGIIKIDKQEFMINQANGCIYTLSPTSSGTISASGGSGNFSVATNNSSCTWSASKPTWVTITSGFSGTGAGTVKYSVAGNGGVERTGYITVGDQSYKVSQAIGPCAQNCASTQTSCYSYLQYCDAQCATQAPPSCSNYPSGCAPLIQACVANCKEQRLTSCNSAYASCIATCQ